MKIQVKTIREEGVELSEVLDREQTGQLGNDVIRFIGEVTVGAHITRAEDELIVRVTAGGRYTTSCYRCLEGIEQDWAVAFTLTFSIEKRTEFIEIGEDIREELIVRLPTRILCREDCQGLCVDCGTNLNHQHCAHRHAVVKS